jgi:hypothetical protein
MILVCLDTAVLYVAGNAIGRVEPICLGILIVYVYSIISADVSAQSRAHMAFTSLHHDVLMT